MQTYNKRRFRSRGICLGGCITIIPPYKIVRADKRDGKGRKTDGSRFLDVEAYGAKRLFGSLSSDRKGGADHGC